MGKSSSSCLKMVACGSNTAAADSDDDLHIHHLTLTSSSTTTTTTTQTKAASPDKRGWSFRKKSARHNLTSAPDKGTHFQSPVKPTTTHHNKPLDDDALPKPPSEPLDDALQKPLDDALPKPLDDDALPKPLDDDALPKPLDDDAPPSKPLDDDALPKPLDDDDALPKPLSQQIQVSHLLLASDDHTNPTSDDTLMLLENPTSHPPIHLGTLTQSLDDFSNGLNSSEDADAAHASVALHERLAITLQASIRAFLTRQQFLHLKNVVMLQAVIRGHLVRRNALETLHCIRGIAKIQALVRAHSSNSLDQNYIKSEGQFSTAKLLKNSFARQLMESTPKPNTVNIRCDPFSPNSAWAWLERWMSVTSAELEKVNQVEPRQSEADIELSARSLSDSFDSKSIVDEFKKSSEGNHVVDPVDAQSSPPFFVEEQPDDHMAEEIYDSVNSVKMDALVNVSSDSHIEPSSLPDEAATEIQQAKLCAKRSALEELNGEGKKLISGSRKASHLEVGADTSSSPEETCIRTSEPSVVGVDVPSDPRIIVAGSECGTELSITSTLDSPDRCELENAQPEPQVKILETSAGCETNPMCHVRSETTQQEEVHEFPGGSSVSAVVAQVLLPGLEQKSEIKASDESMKFPSVVSDVIEENEQKEVISEQGACLEHVTGLPAEKSSPETSPRSHMTLPESHGTPSSQVSLKDKRNKIGKSGSNTKRSSLSAGKRSPSNPNMESGTRSSVEHLAKDRKSGKRRNSFGSTKSDADQEPRDSNSHNSIPSYMQATKSAKAKAHSPRSSPDFHDKEVNSKKRPTLSAAGGRQGSPRVQRSPSEGVQGAKTNGSHPSNERKWQR